MVINKILIDVICERVDVYLDQIFIHASERPIYAWLDLFLFNSYQEQFRMDAKKMQNITNKVNIR